MTDDERNAWLAGRKEAGLKIDPETAEVEWTYAQTLDPYGVYPELPEEYWQVGREYFARSSGSDVVGVVWRPARRNPKCVMGKAQVEVGLSSRSSSRLRRSPEAAIAARGVRPSRRC